MLFVSEVAFSTVVTVAATSGVLAIVALSAASDETAVSAVVSDVATVATVVVSMAGAVTDFSDSGCAVCASVVAIGSDGVTAGADTSTFAVVVSSTRKVLAFSPSAVVVNGLSSSTETSATESELSSFTPGSAADAVSSKS